MDRTARLAWTSIGWTVATVLLGALVRATHSGAGCGRSWPTCQGQVLPELAGATSIEFTHRVASGIALVLVAVLVAVVWRRRPRGHPSRRAAAWAGIAIVAEALIGAAIVFYEWVADDTSVARAVSVPIHLANTLLLLGALTLTAWFLSGGGELDRRGPARRWLLLGATALVGIAATGAVTALADTLFPATGVATESAEHFLTRLRIVHPILAVTAVIAGLMAARRLQSRIPGPVTPLVILVVAQVGLGVANIRFGTPLWLQLLHLAVADVIWISYVWLAAQVLSNNSSNSSAVATGVRHTNPLHK
ncbi:MAG TPA: COX15/CtaA family protein [Acidimicrobiia bacterium]